MDEAVLGLVCPYCQGRLEISEGERIVLCPYCEQCSYLKGERGIIRYQIQRKVDHQAASQSLNEFLIGPNRANGLREQAKITEMFVAYLPFWMIGSRIASWVFGKKKVDKDDYRPVEVKGLYKASWNTPARDVAEVGIRAAQFAGKPLELFNDEKIYEDGMVFEPMGSEQGPLREAHQYFEKEIIKRSRVNKLGSHQIRYFKERIGIVFLPLWITRYLYKERSYQVVLDGYSGEVLYGKAPGNPWFRAAVLIGAMAFGMFLMVQGTAFVLSIDFKMIALLPLFGGIIIIISGYKKYFRGEEIEIRAKDKPGQMSKENSCSKALNGFDVRLAP
jgi:hypothetical protein